MRYFKGQRHLQLCDLASVKDLYVKVSDLISQHILSQQGLREKFRYLWKLQSNFYFLDYGY